MSERRIERSMGSLDLAIELLLEMNPKNFTNVQRERLRSSSIELEKLVSHTTSPRSDTSLTTPREERSLSASSYRLLAPVPIAETTQGNSTEMTQVAKKPVLSLKKAGAMVLGKKEEDKGLLAEIGSSLRRASVMMLLNLQGLSPAEIGKAKKAFEILDESGDGYLTAEELANYFKTIGNEQSIKDVTALMSSIDSNSDGTVGLEEFYRIIIHLKSVHNDVKNLLKKRKALNTIGNDKWVIHPHNPFQMAWEMFITLLLLMLVVTMPLTMAFDSLHEEMGGLNLAIDIFFLLDVTKNFFTGIINDEDAVILDLNLIRRGYLKGWFLADLISSLPLDLIMSAINGPAGADGASGNGGAGVARSAKTVKILRLLRIAKIIRLLRHGSQIAQALEKFAQAFADAKIALHESTIKLLALFTGLCVFCHWLGCINFLITKLADFPEDSWIVYNGLADAPVSRQYTWAFFKALGLMVLQDEQPWAVYNGACEQKIEGWCATEAWLNLGTIYTGQIFFAILIGEMSSLMMGMNIGKRNYHQMQNRVNEYMRAKKLPLDLRQKVRDYYAAQSKGKRLYDETEIMKGLSEQLRMEILRHNSRGLMADVPLLNKSPASFSEALMVSMQPAVRFQGDTVFGEGAVGHQMYFIYSGVVEITSMYRPDETIVTIGDGCYFGDVALLKDVPRTATCHVKTLSIMYTITRKHLFSAFEHHVGGAHEINSHERALVGGPSGQGHMGGASAEGHHHHSGAPGGGAPGGGQQRGGQQSARVDPKEEEGAEEMRGFRAEMERVAEGRYLRMLQLNPRHADIEIPPDLCSDDQDKETALFRAEDELIGQLFGAAANRDRTDPSYRQHAEELIAKTGEGLNMLSEKMGEGLDAIGHSLGMDGAEDSAGEEKWVGDGEVTSANASADDANTVEAGTESTNARPSKKQGKSVHPAEGE